VSLSYFRFLALQNFPLLPYQSTLCFFGGRGNAILWI
jgi:hypothetical protein